MTRPIRVGAMLAVRDNEINQLTDADQDRLITEVAKHLENELRQRVGGAQPLRNSLDFAVTGPHDDPIQGIIHVHHLVGTFDLDRLPTDCEAYRAETTGQAPAPTTTIPGPLTDR